jgi:hypothetical protein
VSLLWHYFSYPQQPFDVKRRMKKSITCLAWYEIMFFMYFVPICKVRRIKSNLTLGYLFNLNFFVHHFGKKTCFWGDEEALKTVLPQFIIAQLENC